MTRTRRATTTAASTATGPATSASAASPSAVEREAAERTAEDVRLAWLHLRVGALDLARAGLEELAGRGALDGASQAALAEARWRSGDLEAAGQAAAAHLEAGGADPVAIAIAAEQAAHAGDTDASVALVERLAELDEAALERLFAGLPRHAPWPGSRDLPSPTTSSAPSADSEAPPVPGRQRGQVRREPAGSPADLEQARRDVVADPPAAALRLALALRTEPALAPAILDVIGAAAEPELSVVRGDALRLLGRHIDADTAYAAARSALERPARRRRD